MKPQEPKEQHPKKNLIPLKELTSEDGRRKYYKYDPANPADWRRERDAPWLKPEYNAQLLDLFGVDKHGDPRMRIAWADSLSETSFVDVGNKTVEYEGKKYPYMRCSYDKGFMYLDSKGVWTEVPTLGQVPKRARTVYPIRGWFDVSVLKFALEMKYTKEELIRMNWYPAEDDEHAWCVRMGKRYKTLPKPNGDYVLVQWFDTPDGEYRDVTQADIDKIEELYRRSLTETPAEFTQRKLEEREKLAKLTEAEQAKREMNVVSNAIIRAQKKARHRTIHVPRSPKLIIP